MTMERIFFKILKFNLLRKLQRFTLENNRKYFNFAKF